MRGSMFGPRQTRHVLAVAGLLGTTAALVACGGSSSGGGTASNASGGTATAGATAGKTKLTVAMGDEPTTLDVLALQDVTASIFAPNVVQTLAERDNDGKKINPSLATSWSGHGSAWTFTLRNDVKFQDGTPMTSADVVASYRKVIDPKVASYLQQDVPTLKSVKAEGKDKVVLTTAGPSPTIPAAATLVGIVPAAWADPSSKKMATEMMGTGPYKFVKWAKGQYIELARNDSYYGTPARYSDIKMVFRPDDAVRLNALQAKEVDIAANLPPDLASRAPKVVKAPQSVVYGLRLKVSVGGKKSGLFQNDALRQAASMAIDSGSIVKNILQDDAAVPNGQNVIPDVFGYNPALKQAPFDPDQAKQLVKANNGGSQTLTADMTNGLTLDDKLVGQAIIQMLTDVGFKIKASYNQSAAFHAGALAPSQHPDDPSATPDITLLANSNEMFDASTTLQGYTCQAKAAAYCDPKVDALVKQASTEMDQAKRQQILQSAWQEFGQNHFVLPIAALDSVYGVASGVAWTPRPDGQMMFDDVKLG
jgi:peptide/nickel transport system substrate-binding protein